MSKDNCKCNCEEVKIMTTGELIEALKECDSDAPVWISTPGKLYPAMVGGTEENRANATVIMTHDWNEFMHPDLLDS